MMRGFVGQLHRVGWRARPPQQRPARASLGEHRAPKFVEARIKRYVGNVVEVDELKRGLPDRPHHPAYPGFRDRAARREVHGPLGRLAISRHPTDGLLATHDIQSPALRTPVDGRVPPLGGDSLAGRRRDATLAPQKRDRGKVHERLVRDC